MSFRPHPDHVTLLLKVFPAFLTAFRTKTSNSFLSPLKCRHKDQPCEKSRASYPELAIARESATITHILVDTQTGRAVGKLYNEKREGFCALLKTVGIGRL